MQVLLNVPVYDKQSERALLIHPEVHFLLMRSLNKKKKNWTIELKIDCAIDQLKSGLKSMAQSIFSSSK